MTDRDIMKLALDALDGLYLPGELDRVNAAITALHERLAHCDRCGKKLGGEGDIHTCTPLIGYMQHDCAKCKARLAQPEQEPVARFSRWGEKGTSGEGYTVHFLGDRPLPPDGALFYTAPPQRRPLSDEQMWELWNLQGDDAMEQQEAIAFARAIEAAHGIKGEA